jgi:hypothetical protein
VLLEHHEINFDCDFRIHVHMDVRVHAEKTLRGISIDRHICVKIGVIFGDEETVEQDFATHLPEKSVKMDQVTREIHLTSNGSVTRSTSMTIEFRTVSVRNFFISIESTAPIDHLFWNQTEIFNNYN